jgi:hypothetical protein
MEVKKELRGMTFSLFWNESGRRNPKKICLYRIPGN